MSNGLKTDRLFLRSAKPEDAEFLVALDSDPEVVRYLLQKSPPTLESASEQISHWMRYKDPRFGFWLVCLLSGEPIGWVHLRPGREAPHPMELGYRLMRAHWGKGYATEISRALLEVSFAQYGLEGIEATCLAANVASWRVMEKVGMNLIEVFEYEGVEAYRYRIHK